jgi:hypothetical protein
MPDSPEIKKIMWKPFFDAMKEAGLLNEPENCRRLVIDAEVGKVLRITYYHYGDTRLLDVVKTSVRETADHQEAVVK